MQVELVQDLGEGAGGGDGVRRPGVADRLGQGAFVVHAVHETAGGAQIGDDFGFDMEDVPRGGGEMSAVADELGHFHADGHGLVRRPCQMEGDLHRHPAPELAFQGEVERSDDPDAALRQRAFELQ